MILPIRLILYSQTVANPILWGHLATAFDQDRERMKFTGHERDLASGAGAGDDLDYMHARHYSPVTGRFTSTDVVDGKPGSPQSWDRYSYVLGNPLKSVDPDGKSAVQASFLLLSVAAVAVTVATLHATRMHSDSQYRQRVVDGATRTGEAATATVSSVLGKRTDGDSAGALAGGEATHGRKGERGRFKSAEDSLDQLLDIEKAQEAVRQGKLGKVIDSVEKSARRFVNDLTLIKAS